MFNQILAKSPAKRAGERLHSEAVAQARHPALYRDLGAPDTVQGRFELLTLHVILLVERLREESGSGGEIGQRLFDVYLSHLDGAIREMGVGDLAVGKRMRGLGEAFYGRARSYDGAFAALPETEPLEALLARTILEGADLARPDGLSAYVLRCREALRRLDINSLVYDPIVWAAP